MHELSDSDEVLIICAGPCYIPEEYEEDDDDEDDDWDDDSDEEAENW